MNIVLEGPDGGGKSTLAKCLAGITKMPLILGEGPPKSPGEINERARRYLQLDNVIFDRHPCVSQQIYGTIRALNGKANEEMIHQSTLREFYSRPTCFVYCKATPDSVHKMTVGADEDPEHITSIYLNYRNLIESYDAWALQHAHFIYRIGQDSQIQDLAHGIRRRINSEQIGECVEVEFDKFLSEHLLG